jgi:uncharacterized Tic20 family protein
MLFYSLVTVVAFTASVSLASTTFETMTHFLNFGTSLLGLIFTFAFSILHPVILFSQKENENWDT